MNLPFRYAMVIAILPIAISRSDSVIEYEWTGDPIPVDLSVGAERRIIVKGADELRIGIPPGLHGKFTAQSINESSWWKSDTPIDSARVIIGVIPTGEYVVTEVSATEDASPLPNLVITIPDGRTSPNTTPGPSLQTGYAALTRWTIQQLYSPARLRRPLAGVTEDSVNKKPMKLFRCGPSVPSACGGSVEATPVAAWRTQNHYVTAVNLENTTDVPIVLDPRDIRGRWRTAAFVHSRLMPAKHPRSSTTLVLISDMPPAEAVME